MDTDEILKILREGTRKERLDWVTNLPETKMSLFAVSSIVSENPDQRIVGLVSPIMEYCRGQNPAVGALLAKAIHEYAIEIYNSDLRQDLLPVTLSNLACQFVNASNLLGRSEEVVQFCNQYIPYYEDMGEYENLPTLILAKANALLNLNKIDEADHEIVQFENNWLKKNLGADIGFHGLKEKIKNMKASHVAVKSESRHTGHVDPENNVFDLLRSRFGELLGDSDQDIALGEAIKKVDPNNRLDMESNEGFQKALEILKKEKIF